MIFCAKKESIMIKILEFVQLKTKTSLSIGIMSIKVMRSNKSLSKTPRLDAKNRIKLRVQSPYGFREKMSKHTFSF